MSVTGRMQSSRANATTGVNTVDNVERVPRRHTALRRALHHHGEPCWLAHGRLADLLAHHLRPDHGAVLISPGDSFTTTGSAGGPFTPSSKAYTLSNLGGTALNWSAASNQTWLSIFPPNGTLNVGENISVTASLTAAANSLPSGNHSATLTFTNTTSGFTITRGAALSVGRSFYSFNLINPGWTTTGQWGFGTPSGVEGDPTTAKTGTNVYGYNLAGAYTNSMPAYSLTTTALNCSGKEHAASAFGAGWASSPPISIKPACR